MSAQIIDGKKISDEIKAELKSEIEGLKRRGIVPGLAAVLVGSNPASALYVKMKAKACEQVGIFSEVIKKDDYLRHGEMVDLVTELNNRDYRRYPGAVTAAEPYRRAGHHHADGPAERCRWFSSGQPGAAVGRQFAIRTCDASGDFGAIGAIWS